MLSRADAIMQQIRDAADTADAWDRIFTGEEYSGAVLAEVFARLHAARRFEAAVQGILAAIRNDHAQPWMYDVLAVEMNLAGRPQKDVDRALLSRVDFAKNAPDQLLVTAALLARFDAFDQAIAMCREATERDPWHSDAWLLARRVADRSRSVEHVRWSRLGILKYVWSDNFDSLHAEARTTLNDLQQSLTAAGRSDAASEVREDLRQALQRDLRIRVEWAGLGDVDLIVNEPGNQTCSYRRKLTSNGGVMIHTSDGASAAAVKGRSAEEYLCREAPSGTYDVTVRLVSGRVITGNVVVQVTQYENTPAETTKRVQIAVGSNDAALKVELHRGRGKPPE